MLSGDSALLGACESGDVYLGVARQLGFLPGSLNDMGRKSVRALFKTVVLGIQYGLGYRSLAARTGISLFEAAEILARLRARFRRCEEYAQGVALWVSVPASIDRRISTRHLKRPCCL